MKNNTIIKFKFIVGLLFTMMSTYTYTGHALELQSGQNKNQLLELFTSEGCSSCPPADKYLSNLKNHPKLWIDFIPVAFHVDYWDYIGWQDKFASERFSKRQRDYQQQGHISQVYTPGFVVDGQEWRGFFSRDDIPEIKDILSGELKVQTDDKNISIDFQDLADNNAELIANVAILGFDLISEVKTGENSGVDLHHDFTVIGYKQFAISKNGDGDGFKAQDLLPETVVDSEQKALAVWLSSAKNSQPIQVVGGWL